MREARGDWRVRDKQYGIWKCLGQADLARLPDIKITMQSEWSFSCRSELLVFLEQAASMYAQVWARGQGVVFRAVTLNVHRLPGCKVDGEKLAKGYRLASAKIRVPMKWATFAVDVCLCDETGEENEPRISLRVDVEDVNSSWEERWDSIRFRALCPADMEYCSERNPYLSREVWERVLEVDTPYRNEILSYHKRSRTRTFFLREKLGISSVCTSQMNVTHFVPGVSRQYPRR